MDTTIVALAAPGMPTGVQEAPEEVRVPQPGARILVVDDEPDIRDALQQILEESLGVAVAVAATGLEARTRIERGERYDIILTDERMPGLRGSELLAWLREHHPGSMRLLMSAFYEGYLGTDLARQAGAARFLRKPLDLKELLPLLRTALGPAGSGKKAAEEPTNGAESRGRSRGWPGQ
jgi:DNA-binding NtrC family response regulator